MNLRYHLRNLFGYLPLAPEIIWHLRHKRQYINDQYQFRSLPEVINESAKIAASNRGMEMKKKVVIFSTLHYWIEHTALTGIALAGLGNKVTLAYYPYANWFSPVDHWTLRLRVLYSKSILAKANSVLTSVCFTDYTSRMTLPDELQKAVETVSYYDSQYTLQAEEIDKKNPVYLLRIRRNSAAARAAYLHFKADRPDVVIVPNGVILEFGVVYAVARYLNIPVVTYEFGEQSGHLWLAQNAQIIKHETDDLWEARGKLPLTPEQLNRLEAFFKARQVNQRGDSFARLWQEISPQGGANIRQKLGLDSRPIVLFTTNVLGDSLTLGRQIFGPTMSEWVTRLVKYFYNHNEVQLVIRIHPGENLTKGPSVTGVIQKALPNIPEHIHLIGPKEKVNTYDLMDIASLGIVYTTTSGLEMATRGIPVMTAGKSHYRCRGFTIDSQSYEEFFSRLDQILPDLPAHRLSKEQIETAWNYSYRFFHEFPRPFPWHILHVAEDVQTNPMQRVLGAEGLSRYLTTFQYLSGEPMDWRNID